jgi:hypothetical protein
MANDDPRAKALAKQMLDSYYNNIKLAKTDAEKDEVRKNWIESASQVSNIRNKYENIRNGKTYLDIVRDWNRVTNKKEYNAFKKKWKSFTNSGTTEGNYYKEAVNTQPDYAKNAAYVKKEKADMAHTNLANKEMKRTLNWTIKNWIEAPNHDDIDHIMFVSNKSPQYKGSKWKSSDKRSDKSLWTRSKLGKESYYAGHNGKKFVFSEDPDIKKRQMAYLDRVSGWANDNPDKWFKIRDAAEMKNLQVSAGEGGYFAVDEAGVELSELFSGAEAASITERELADLDLGQMLANDLEEDDAFSLRNSRMNSLEVINSERARLQEVQLSDFPMSGDIPVGSGVGAPAIGVEWEEIMAKTKRLGPLQTTVPKFHGLGGGHDDSSSGAVGTHHRNILQGMQLFV